MTTLQTRRPGELVFALMLVVFSATAFWQSHAISGFRGLSEPGVFPMLASATMLLSAIIIMRETLTKKMPEGTPAPISTQFLTDVVPPRLIGMIVLILAYVATMPLLGFVVSSALFLFASYWFLWRKNPLISAALTVVSLSIIYFIFRRIFQVVLPEGSLIQGLF